MNLRVFLTKTEEGYVDVFEAPGRPEAGSLAKDMAENGKMEVDNTTVKITGFTELTKEE